MHRLPNEKQLFIACYSAIQSRYTYFRWNNKRRTWFSSNPDGMDLRISLFICFLFAWLDWSCLYDGYCFEMYHPEVLLSCFVFSYFVLVFVLFVHACQYLWSWNLYKYVGFLRLFLLKWLFIQWNNLCW